MIQLQILNYVIKNKDISILADNGITSDYFLEYADEFEFIQKHYENYKIIPDMATVVSNFPDFEVLDVHESERYLIDGLREEYLYSKSVPVIKRAAELLKADANEAGRYLQSEIVNLTPNYTIPSVDIAHSSDRIDLFENKSVEPNRWYIPTGFEELDFALNGGWQIGEEYVVFFARTNQGKSWVVCKVAQHAWSVGKNVGYISPEMSADKIGYRFDTLNHNFSNKALLRGDVSEISVDEYKQYFKTLSSNDNKFIVATPVDFNKKITVSKLKSFIKANKLDLLVVDGITYMSDERYKKGDNKTTTLTNISEDLIQLSVELKVPIIVVVQSNREGVKDEPDATPELENIRDSDGISHNATKVIALKQKDGALILEVKKNRDGVVGTKLTYQWDIDNGEFVYTSSTNDGVKEDVKQDVKISLSKSHKNEGRVAF